ncbi:MAG TPA: T9SS type A sorting domain-containing protein, partial [Bacteroidota bacterium]|nr:T9SS type A sorting domain-containing protein [Bacteroidota bacterium]
GGLPGLAKSFLWEKVNAPEQEHFYTDHPLYGSIMPLGMPYLTNGELEFIKAWIIAGSPEVGSVADTSLLEDTTRFVPPPFVVLDPPTSGIQFHLGPFNVPPNQVYDREFFYFEPLTHTSDLFVNRVEISMRPGSHHFLLYTFPPGTPGSVMPSPHTYRDIRDSLGNMDYTVLVQMAYHRFFQGTQTPYLNYQFPHGVALRLPAHTGLDLNSHYVNRSSQAITGEVYANIHTIDSAAVDHIAEILFLNNTNISLPPRQVTTVTQTFSFPQTRHIVFFWSHAHEHMQEFRVERAGGVNDGQVIYFSSDWQHPPILRLDPPLTVNAGEGLKLITTYNNWTDNTITFGLLSSDEMQILYGAYYTGAVTAVDEANSAPSSFELEANYPNPFNSGTDFGFRIADIGFVTLKVFDVLGREVTSLVNEELQPGGYKVSWHATNEPSGVYYARLSVSSSLTRGLDPTSRVGQSWTFSQVRKLLLLR